MINLLENVIQLLLIIVIVVKYLEIEIYVWHLLKKSIVNGMFSL